MIGSNEDDGLILTTSLTTDPSLYLLYRSVLYLLTILTLLILLSQKPVVCDSPGHSIPYPCGEFKPGGLKESHGAG